MNWKQILSIAIIAGASSCFAGVEKPVFAHYMTCFGLNLDFCKYEIALARQYGLDGFAMNCGNWKNQNPKTGELTATGYVENSDFMFEGAKQQNSGFKLIMSPDSNLEHYKKAFHEDMAIRYANHPNLFRWKGKPVISGWGGRMDKYRYMKDNLQKQGYDYVVIPSVGTNRHSMQIPSDLILRERLLPKDSPYDGIFMFSCDGTTQDEVKKNANLRFASMQANKIYMAGACPSYNSSNLRDFHGVLGYMAMWEGIVNDQPEMVEIVTWNDYAEDSNIMAGSGFSKGTYDHDESFLDLTAYYSAFYKTEVRPEITQDKIYTCYRTHFRHQSMAYDYVKEKKWIDLRSRFLQVHDDARDFVYLTAFLTDDADVSIIQGKNIVKMRLKKGISSLEAPMIPGATPEFKVVRKGKDVINVGGRRQIVAKETQRSSSMKYGGWATNHRTWTSCSIAGPVEKTFLAKDAESKSASIEKGVAMLKENGSSISWKLGDLKLGSFDFRVTYVNREAEESRLTLFADIPSMNTKGRWYPVQFPLHLPPTGGKEAVQSFLFTLPEGTENIRISKCFDSKPDSDVNDYGEGGIVKIELIRNQIYTAVPRKQTFPELVLLPAGKFMMGANALEPDEKPSKNVEISSFALGKFEVTNREFEEFMPDHRNYRTALSWRDREPVIYVSWRDAAGYCNFLSKKHGLKEYYNPKDWTVNKEANGFRLPSEAQWEYAASGRGENRIYPWGNEKPTIECANIDPNCFSQSARLKAQPEGGVTIVGSYPDGASRDGIMDLAGNVAEWCDDFYNPVRSVSEKDPLDLNLNQHRSIRGGSWGYYGSTQRNCDREFNNPGYPGYIYLGFRVSIPKTGYDLLMKKLK